MDPRLIQCAIELCGWHRTEYHEDRFWSSATGEITAETSPQRCELSNAGLLALVQKLGACGWSYCMQDPVGTAALETNGARLHTWTKYDDSEDGRAEAKEIVAHVDFAHAALLAAQAEVGKNR
jgi:hypothetical protein